MIEVDCKPLPISNKIEPCMDWVNNFRFITRSFGTKPLDIKNIPYIDMVEEMLSDKPINETKYYKYLMQILKQHNCVWDYIKTEEDVYNRALKFRELARDIQNNGFDVTKNDISIKNNLPYGRITFIKEDIQTTVLIDGHHRISVLIYLGVNSFEIHDNFLIPIL